MRVSHFGTRRLARRCFSHGSGLETLGVHRAVNRAYSASVRRVDVLETIDQYRKYRAGLEQVHVSDCVRTCAALCSRVCSCQLTPTCARELYSGLHGWPRPNDGLSSRWTSGTVPPRARRVRHRRCNDFCQPQSVCCPRRSRHIPTRALPLLPKRRSSHSKQPIALSVSGRLSTVIPRPF
eukprot:SAG11_NODE_8947_length_960_cov_1.047619_1_plen_180_part_00